ncbi:MAG: hypothetical protein Q7T50_07015, partial [Candidatus Magasanikbacteria bacterium]|nr:hypothetical protein [Candidatus Magasanikbacteria bacterium]
EFTKRPLPTDEQVEDFEERIEEDSHDEEVEKSLNEIYHDDNGEVVDVQKIKILKKRGFFFWFFSFIFTVAFVGGLGYGFYYFIYKNIGSNAKAVEFSIEGKTEVIAGEEFIYTLKYKNSINVGINNLQVTVVYPTNFIVSDINPQPAPEKNSVWNIPFLGPGQTGEIKVRGRIIGAENELSVISGYVTYMPENFSSEFKREATLTTVVKDVGIDFDFDYANIALAGQESEIVMFFESKDNNFINNFRLTVEPQDNIEILSSEKKAEEVDNKKLAKNTLIRPGVWQIDEVLDEQRELTIKYKILQKVSDKQEIVLNFEQVGADNKSFRFFQKKIELDVMNNDLNVNLIINGSRSDQGVGLGDTLNYSIVYSNRGETEMKDIVIMATLDSEYLNWDTLADKNNGQVKRSTITWTKDQIPNLASLTKNSEGSIDFSIKLAKSGSSSEGGNYEVKSYAQFNIGSLSDGKKESEDNRSNVIVNKINSDLKISESVRYFSEDNIPVGSGPNPPKVGENTTYKVYWKLENTIHELDELAVRVKLPAYVTWNNKVQVTAGVMNYDSGTNEVLWHIGRLPSSINQAYGEFSIGITPGQNDLNKILILTPGSKVSALDAETGAEIGLSTKAQTTKLDGDEIGAGDGIVQ